MTMSNILPMARFAAQCRAIMRQIDSTPTSVYGIARPYSKTHDAAVAALRKAGGPMMIAEIAAAIGIGQSRTARVCQQLFEQGRITGEKVRHNRTTKIRYRSDEK